MRVLAVGAHPDDLEILCAGTLARYVAQGHDVIMAHASRGDKGHGEIPHPEVGETRDREAEAAADVIGAESMSLGFLDGEIYVNDDSMRRVVDMIRVAKPDLIITHHPDDYHGDHSALTKLVLDASFLATVPYYVTSEPAHPVTPPVYFMDTLAGIDFTPTDYVDITEMLELKKEAMAQHDSQITWLRDHHATDILDYIETIARFRGLQCGAQYAEGFQQMRAWGRMSPERLLP
ncbi:MAG: N-acetyl-alpha-D-glucosaminyl L-malate deacetylase 1 [Anaerolineales bacterium]|nr:N-acetyl-alpha-D-glucosaminyl L-malate deacetylase 1 [Anaerolineales bacterium]